MKGQSSLELMVMTGIVLAFFLVSVLWFASNQQEINNYKSVLEAKGLCHKVRGVIHDVSTMGYNAAETFTVPNGTTGNLTLTVFADSRLIQASAGESEVYCTLLTPNVTNSTNQTFSLTSGQYVARNIEGVVVLSAE